jgi:hypothetical protein
MTAGLITGRVKRALPQGSPVYDGARPTTREIANVHLAKAKAYLDERGSWSEELRRYVDDWLDWVLAERTLAEIRDLPEASAEARSAVRGGSGAEWS